MSYCPWFTFKTLVRTTPTISVRFALYLAEVSIWSCRYARRKFCENSIKNYWVIAPDLTLKCLSWQLQFLSNSLYTWQKSPLGAKDVQDANFVKILSRVNELLPLIRLKKSCFNLFLLTRSFFYFNKNKTIPIFVNISLLYPGKIKVFRG